MKKTILILAVLLCGVQMTGFSQNARVGVAAGFVISDIRGTTNQMNHAVKTGAMLGLVVDAPLDDHFTFQPSLNYIQKGNIQKENSQEKITIALRYAELHFNFLYNFSGNSKAGLYAGAGPSVAFNIPSKRITENRAGTKTNSDILFGETVENDLKGIDYGVNFQLGYKLPGGVYFSTFYDMGLRNLAPGENTTGKIKNAAFGIQVGLLVNN